MDKIEMLFCDLPWKMGFHTLQEISDEGIDIMSLSYPVFLSVPSFFALSWAKEFIDEIKKKKQDIQIVVGGRWTVDNNLV